MFGGLNQFSPDLLKGQRLITGVAEETTYEGTFKLIASLCPEARNVLLISNKSANARASRLSFERHQARYQSLYHFEYYDDWTNAQLIERLAKLPDDWVGMILEATQDVTGHQNYNDAEFSRQLTTLTRRPIFINAHATPQNEWAAGTWNGIGGGLLVADIHGERVGEIALRVLSGESADSIPVEPFTAELLSVDYRHLLRFGLEHRELPPGTRVFNEPQSFYRVHLVQIIIVACVILVLVSAVVVLSMNIILRRRAETALRRARAELDLLAKGIEQASDIILILHPGGELRYANLAFERLCGLHSGAWRTRTLDQVLPSFGVRHPLPEMMEAASTRGDWSGLLEMQPVEGTAILLQARIARITLPSQGGHHLVFIGRDITRERRLEEQLHSSQKLEAVGLLAGGVAHDFNNILQIIQGHAALLVEDLAGTPHAEGMVEIRDAAERATQLTRQLLVFSRRQTMNWEVLDPSQLVADMLRMIRRLIGEHIEIRFNPLVEHLHLHADKGQLEQVILNLCVNARDAMPKGGRLSLDLSCLELGPDDCAAQGGLPAGTYIKLSVGDTGCGMTAEVQARIFEPFFTTKPVGQGTGLGLSVVYGIIKNHKGLVRVYSEPGHGTVFSVLLPVSREGPAAVQGADSAAVAKGSGLVLLAEDDAPVQLLAIRTLTRGGYEVIAAPDGQAALELLGQHADRVRLVMLDVMMPKLSGRQVYEVLHRRHPRIPVLFCSGYSPEALPPEMAPAPGLALISKPYAGRDLLLTIERLLKDSASA